MAALLSQDAALGSIGGNAIINASASGAELVAVAVQQVRFTYQVMSDPSLQTFADLRGKRSASPTSAARPISPPNTRSTSSACGAAKTWPSSPRQPERTALGLRPAPLPPPCSKPPSPPPPAKSATKSSSITPTRIRGAITTIVTHRAYLRDHPDVVQRYVTALVDATHYFKTDRQGTLSIIGRFLGQDDPETLEDIYRESAGPIMLEVPTPRAATFAAAIHDIAPHNENAARINPNDLVDDRFIRQLVDSS